MNKPNFTILTGEIFNSEISEIMAFLSQKTGRAKIKNCIHTFTRSNFLFSMVLCCLAEDENGLCNFREWKANSTPFVTKNKKSKMRTRQQFFALYKPKTRPPHMLAGRMCHHTTIPTNGAI